MRENQAEHYTCPGGSAGAVPRVFCGSPMDKLSSSHLRGSRNLVEFSACFKRV
jgi:hypothetical protein